MNFDSAHRSLGCSVRCPQRKIQRVTPKCAEDIAHYNAMSPVNATDNARHSSWKVDSGLRGAVRRLGELLVGQFASDDFLECNIGERHAWRRFNHGPMSQAKLANAFGNDVDQKLLIRDHLSCFLQKLSRHMAQGRDGADCFRRELKNDRQTAGQSGWGKLRGEHGKNEC